jgi:hypothetical protein
MTDENLQPQFDVSLSDIVNAYFTVCITVFAAWVIVTQIALLAGLSFFSLSIIYSIVIIPVLVFSIKKYYGLFKRSSGKLPANELNALIILAALALAGAVVSFCAIRPDLDDVNYTARAVYFLKNIHQPLDLSLHDHGLVNFSLYTPLHIFQTMEFFCAYLALITHLPFLHIYHLFLPAWGGAMIPLAWFLVCSKFSKRTIVAVMGAAAICAFLCLDGTPHRSFGNFGFVRIWQNKVILMSVGVPLFTAFTLDFFRATTVWSWLRILMSVVCTAGLTSMTSFFMPFLGILLGGSCWFARGIRSLENLKKVSAYYASYFYLVLIVLYSYVNLDRTRMEFVGNQGWPKTFAGQFKLVFIDTFSYPAIVLMIFTLLSVFIAKGKNRVFLVAWIVLSVVLFLNPYSFRFVGYEATTLNNYWRLFFLFPFPLVIGVSMGLFDRIKKFRSVYAYLMVAGLVLVALVGNLRPYHYATFKNIPFAPGQYKIEAGLEAQVNKIIEVSVPGPMLSPIKYSSVIPRYSPDYPQVRVRKRGLLSFSLQPARRREIQKKIVATDYVSGRSRVGQQYIMVLIERGLKNIVVNAQVTRGRSWRDFKPKLIKNGFKCVETNKYFHVYTKH